MYLGPLVALHAVLVVGTASLEQGLVRAPAARDDANHLPRKAGGKQEGGRGGRREGLG